VEAYFIRFFAHNFPIWMGLKMWGYFFTPGSIQSSFRIARYANLPIRTIMVLKKDYMKNIQFARKEPGLTSIFP
jgi:hypothetical protein